MVCDSERNTVFDTGQLDGYERHLPNPPNGMTVLQCSDCGLFFFDPQPSIEQLRSYHSKQYFVCYDPLKQIGYLNYIDAEHLKVKEEWGQRIFSWFLSFDDDRTSAKKVLDVGCATGTMLHGMKKTFKNLNKAVGVDISNWAIEWGSKNYSDIELYCGRLPEVVSELQLGFDYVFDYVVFWDSLEHDSNVHEVLETVRNIMTSDSLMIIQTPDGALAKHDWYYWSPHQHTCIFNETNLSMLLKQHGFKIIRKRLSSEPDEIVVLAKREH